MRTEGKISKVAICENCQGYALASHIDYLDRKTENQFNKFANLGFLIKIETAEETRSRGYTPSEDCINGNCTPKKKHP